MIRRIEALGYRCLKYVRQDLLPFQVLVGPNASGKSTFLDVVAFLGDLLHEGPEVAVRDRAPSFEELTWNPEGSRLQVAVELAIPGSLQARLGAGSHSHCRYEVAVGSDPSSSEVRVLAETFWLKGDEPAPPRQRTLFPMEVEAPDTIMRRSAKAAKGWRKIVNKVEESGNDYFRSETGEWNNLFRLGPRKPALANLPEDESKFPVTTWAKRLLMEGVQRLTLNSLAMRKPSPPGSPNAFRPDGSNLPVVIRWLQKQQPKRASDWMEHLRTALPDFDRIKVVERPEDRHLYLAMVYATGLEVPSWVVSDGTLRLLALTLLAYLPGRNAVYLVEEPENGIHPRAIETAFQSLSSVYEAQVLLASHSPVVLGLAKPDQILCFGKAEDGATDIVVGSEHPALRSWQGETNLGVLYASGVLG